LRAPLVGYLYNNLSAPAGRTFEHLVPLARLVEPQHFAHFGLEFPGVDHSSDCCQAVRRYFNEEEKRTNAVLLGFF
jgi:hypothetical protein